MASVTIHLATIEPPTKVTVRQSLDAARVAFQAAGLEVLDGISSLLDLPHLADVSAGRCRSDQLTMEQLDLFQVRLAPTGIHAYLVRTTVPLYLGCAAHVRGEPSLIVASTASRWTLAHEIGHLLGLAHVGDKTRLMYGSGTDRITSNPPQLSAAEIQTIMASPYLEP